MQVIFNSRKVSVRFAIGLATVVRMRWAIAVISASTPALLGAHIDTITNDRYAKVKLRYDMRSPVLDNAQQAREIQPALDKAALPSCSRTVDHHVRVSTDSAKVSIIDDMAYQTHLPALNATIETAWSGERGEGFVVVAAGLRNFAERADTLLDSIQPRRRQAARPEPPNPRVRSGPGPARPAPADPFAGDVAPDEADFMRFLDRLPLIR